jgi:uncharacterized Rmd1/YagE family protein
VRLLRARAFHLGARLDLRDLPVGDALPDSPHAMHVGAGYAFLYRFGTVVLFGLTDAEEEAWLAELAPRVERPIATPEHEELMLRIEAGAQDRVDPEGTVSLADTDPDRLQVVAHVLAKSTALAHFERRVARAVDRVEALARNLASRARPARDQELLEELGGVLLTQAHTVGRVEVAEKPEATWDAPALDRLYERLASEFELRARDLALERKLGLISTTTETYLDLLHNRRSLRLERYILGLIALELVLSLYQMFGPAS